MGNENKWEYDYSSQNRPEGGTGYPNVGSSGMNTANQYNDTQPPVYSYKLGILFFESAR